MKIAQVMISAAKGSVPFRNALRRAARLVRPYEDDPGNSAYCITNGLEQLVALKDAGVSVHNATVLEFGTGWLPLIPLLFHLAGARRLILTDIIKFMDAQTIVRAKSVVRGRLRDVSEALQIPLDKLEHSLQGPFEFDYMVPWNAGRQPSSSVDLIISRAAFEHVPVQQMRFFLEHFHRILRQDGAMCHVIDNSDHWQHHDRSLSRLNFLRYEESNWLWRLAQFSNFQNRLRHDDYRRLFREAGFTIVDERAEPDPTALTDLPRLPLSTPYRNKHPSDLAVLISLFVLRRSQPAFPTG